MFHPAAIVRTRGSVRWLGQTISKPLLLVPDGIGELADLKTVSHDAFETCPGHNRRSGKRIDLAKPAVADHKPIIGVVQHKRIAQGFDGLLKIGARRSSFCRRPTQRLSLFTPVGDIDLDRQISFNRTAFVMHWLNVERQPVFPTAA